MANPIHTTKQADSILIVRISDPNIHIQNNQHVQPL